jgi:putative DNA primase/helicase
MPVINMRDVLAKAAAADSVEGSEDQLALDFSHRHADELRYCAVWGKWLHWDEVRWKVEPTLAVYDLARAVAKDYARALNDKKLANSKTIHGVVWLARADRRHAAVIEQWDKDPWLINTLSGTVELPAGRLRSHRKEDYLTKVTAAAPGGPCSLWKQFLLQIMGNDSELVAYLQRVAGYCLTGSTREHALFFCYGTGANGKGTFINTLKAVFGEYAAVAPMETFLASKSDRHPTDLAGLRGARLICSQEVQEGRRWDAVKIKALTGGDPISARFMRQDFFTYTPEFKLLLAGNHKPGLSGVDEAWRRRFNLIPFKVTIPKAERDPDLSEKLKVEWPGVLLWAIEGCRQWAERGLDPPPTVIEATESYLREQDRIGRWIEEECALDSIYSDTIAHLFASWKGWSERSGLHPGSNTRLSEALEERGFERTRIGHDRDRGFKGIAVKPKPDPPPWV